MPERKGSFGATPAPPQMAGASYRGGAGNGTEHSREQVRGRAGSAPVFVRGSPGTAPVLGGQFPG
jgi:hypothetical protein